MPPLRNDEHACRPLDCSPVRRVTVTSAVWFQQGHWKDAVDETKRVGQETHKDQDIFGPYMNIVIILCMLIDTLTYTTSTTYLTAPAVVDNRNTAEAREFKGERGAEENGVKPNPSSLENPTKP